MPAANLVVRRAALDEAGLIAELGARTFRATFAADNTPDDIELYIASAFALHQIEAELSDPASVFLLGCVGERAVGYAKLRAGDVPECIRGPRPVELVRLYVDHLIIGKGYGAALLEACLEWARASGWATIWLGVWERNERALAFYRRWGFVEVGTHEFVVGHDVQTDLLMERQVS